MKKITTLPNNQKENWEEQFDKKFQPKTKGAVAMINFDFFVADEIKAFIRRLISDYSQRVEEKMKEMRFDTADTGNDEYSLGHNMALSKLSSFINSLNKEYGL